MRNHNLAFLDLEATGPILGKHEILEIGCVITNPALEVIEEFELKVKPQHIKNADPVALKVNGYKEEDWADAVSLEDAMKVVVSKLKDCILVGQNVAFDSSFLEDAFAKTGLTSTLHYHRLDTISIAWAKLHGEKDLEHFSLRELCLRFGIVNIDAHRALSDARATFALYKKLMSL